MEQLADDPGSHATDAPNFLHDVQRCRLAAESACLMPCRAPSAASDTFEDHMAQRKCARLLRDATRNRPKSTPGTSSGRPQKAHVLAVDGDVGAGDKGDGGTGVDDKDAAIVAGVSALESWQTSMGATRDTKDSLSSSTFFDEGTRHTMQRYRSF